MIQHRKPKNRTRKNGPHKIRTLNGVRMKWTKEKNPDGKRIFSCCECNQQGTRLELGIHDCPGKNDKATL